MVMEAATLSGPHRKCTVVPVQKSLSLPSYARAGGEGIDHRLIFAALEQKERVRRRSRIFAPRKEKRARQTNLFCLPIPSSGAKCRETSFSSDTSCSSLEYQKTSPVLSKKEAAVKSKREDRTKEGAADLQEENIDKSPKENIAKPVSPKLELQSSEAAITIQPEIKSNLHPSRTARNGASWDNSLLYTKLDGTLSQKEPRRGQRSPVDSFKLSVGSSDSMDRSSRSSSDSLSRKERMIALKARVEAAREKYGSSSSEEGETHSVMTRYNSDGVIHRSVREVKSRSFLREKRLRRRSQDEVSIKKIHRKQNLSLTLNPEGDGIRLDLEKSSSIQESTNNLDIKTDFCPSPNFPDLIKKNYFSDFSSKENAALFVQARIRHIEDEERKRRSGSDFREKFGIQSPRPQNLEGASPASTERRRPFEKLNGSSNNISDMKPLNLDLAMRSSPIPRSAQAPTPPPRSPKSMTFVNKALIQHQNSYLVNQEGSLERKKILHSNISAVSYSQIFDKYGSKSELTSGGTKLNGTESSNVTSENQKVRELISTRRKTCGNFDFIDNDILNDLCSLGSSVNSNTSNLVANKKFSSVLQIKKSESKGYFSSSETPCVPSDDDARGKLWKSKWQENEQRKEYMFNSLESKKKSNPPSWMKWKTPPLKTETCLCRLFPDNKLSCSCKSRSIESTQMYPSAANSFSALENFGLVNAKDTSALSEHFPSNRLDKLSINGCSNDPSPEVSRNHSLKTVRQTRESLSKRDDGFKNEYMEKLSATANLDSAMEELESVYRSLKMSSDNLSDRNSVSNVSLSDDDVKFPKPKNKESVGISDSRFQRRSSVCETGLVSNKNRLLNYHRSPVFSTSNTAVSSTNDKTLEIDQFSIDELFNDLTQQLDLEQKLLKEPRDTRHQQPKISHLTNRFDNPKRSVNPSPQVSIHKEFYENLCKHNLEQNNKTKNALVCENGSIAPTEPFTKKKYKAVRSLSENISHLMSNPNQNPSADRQTVNSTIAKTTLVEQSSPKHYERVLPDPPKLDVKRNLDPSLRSENAALSSKRDEIRHIRVSMDTFQPKPTPSASALPDARQYPSLSSAVSSTKPEVPKHCPPEQSFDSKENHDVLDETGLEKLLNSLLGEVPERQSSLPQSKDLGPATPPPVVPGEMRVLQHLDVIRLKPVPS